MLARIHENSTTETQSFHEITKIRKHTQAMARFRLSSHGLRIETGRWRKPPIPRELRHCRHCAAHTVDDEAHFLFECTAHISSRIKFQMRLQDKNLDAFDAFTNKDIQKLFNNAEIIPMLASYLYNTLRERKELEAKK